MVFEAVAVAAAPVLLAPFAAASGPSSGSSTYFKSLQDPTQHSTATADKYFAAAAERHALCVSRQACVIKALQWQPLQQYAHAAQQACMASAAGA